MFTVSKVTNLPPRPVTLAGDKPGTAMVTVVSLERYEDPRVDGPIGLDAVLDVVVEGDTKPHRHSASRLVGERGWVEELYVRPTGEPELIHVLFHGVGCRCELKRALPTELGVFLDEVARGSGLVSAISDGVPLGLPSDESTETEGAL